MMRAAPAPIRACLWAAVLSVIVAGSVRAQVLVNGRVLDENGAAVSGARVEFSSLGASVVSHTVSDSQGWFVLHLGHPGEYMLLAERPGFFVVKRKIAIGEQGLSDITITLNHLQELVESVDVVYSPPVIDQAEISDRKQLNNVEILEIPYPASHDLRNALPLFSGVVQDNEGQIHFNGGASDQTNINLDGFNIADPVTGLFETRLSIDSVRSLDLESGRFAADKGRGSAGSLDIKTGMGDDRWRFGITNFVPGISTRRGLAIDKWTPRITFSGPIVRGRAWFQNSSDAFYDVDIIEELPRGDDRTRSVTASNLTRAQVNLTPSNILIGSFLKNYFDNDYGGLAYLNPIEATVHRQRSLNMGTLKDQIYLRRGMLIELGFAVSRGRNKSAPQGSETYVISPFGKSGNYFVNLDRHFRREQWVGDVTLPEWKAAGKHQLRAGLDFQHSGFDQSVDRHDYRVLRTDGTLARHVFFAGNGTLAKTNFESSVYAQDRWIPREGLVVEAGLRTDWDQIVRDLLFSPRLGVAWSPSWLRDTKFSAGFGVFNDSLNLSTLTRHQDQHSIATFYSRSGQVMRGPVESGFIVDEQTLRSPRARMFSASAERKLPLQFYGKVSYVRRAGLNGFVFLEPRVAGDLSKTLFELSNGRHDRYNAVDLSVRRTFAGKFEWMASYTYSRARSNAIVDYSLEEPVYAPQAAGPLAWDTPHRFLMWGWAPVPRSILPFGLKWLLRDTDATYLVETRSGFPFSVVNEEGFQVGSPNERRLPYYFNVNLHLERRFPFLNYLWAWRFGFNNLSNHGNPNVVNNNIDSPSFLSYGGGQRRAFSVRLRFLGRK